jgi:glycosyltransferase involved in cell wall biosynthesis
MRRVLHLIPYMHADAGGPPVVVRRIGGLAARHGWEASVLTTMLFAEDEAEMLASLSDFAEPTVLPRLSRLGELAPPRGIRAALTTAIGKADIVHLHGLWHPLLTRAMRLCRRRQLPYVVMPHGMLDPYSVAQKGLWKRAYLALMERSTLLGAAAIAFTTPAEEEAARGVVGRLPPTVMVPLAGDSTGAGEPERFLAAFPAAKGRRIALFLGRLHHKKGLDRLIAALPTIAAAVPDILLVVAGGGAEDYAEGLRLEAARLGVADRILWTGPLAGALKEAAFAAARCFVLPSRQENFAIAVAEALAAGLPVVLSDRVNTAALVKEAGAGIVLAEDGIHASLPRAVIRLLAEPDAAGEMGRRAKALAAREWSWERSAALLYGAYDAILDRAGAGTAEPAAARLATADGPGDGSGG